MQNMEWYALLIKPPLTPPDQVFMIVWPILYMLIGISFLIFLRAKENRKKSTGIITFVIQTGLNLLWSPVFFGLKSPGASLVVPCLLSFFLAQTFRIFYISSKTAFFLLLPYGIWILFALYLNIGIVVLNWKKRRN